MTSGTSIDTPAAAGAIIRARRQDRGLSQQSLAEGAGVSRKFLIDLEAGHDRAELGKTLAVLRPWPVTGRHRSHPPRQRLRPGTARLRRNLYPAYRLTGTSSSPSRCSPTTPPHPSKPERRCSSAAPGSKNHTGPQPSPASPTTPHTGSANPHHPGPDASNPSTQAWMPAESYRSVRNP